MQRSLPMGRCSRRGLASWSAMTIAFAGLGLASCATIGPDSPALAERPITVEMLLQQSPLGVDTGPPETSVDQILELTPEMAAFVDQNVDSQQSEYRRLKDLVYAIMGTDRFQLIYDDSTRTARETFEQRRGNCLSFTNLFVAMARYAGIEATFQEVEIPPDWSLTGESFLLNKHINVFVRLRNSDARIVDFNTYDFSTTYERHVISDQRARAHYFNNIGAERMLNGETPGALANFFASLEEDRSFSPAWINLGVLYRREGYGGYAEAAFLQALELEPGSLVAISNLASLYEYAGLSAIAETYRQKVQAHRMHNPFYRYYLAQDAFTSGDYRGAITHLKYAIRRHENEPRFYSLLSLSYLMDGDRTEAQRWMKRAKEASVKNQEQEKYGRKLMWLMQQQP